MDNVAVPFASRACVLSSRQSEHLRSTGCFSVRVVLDAPV
jgi:hypothetical protein